MSTAKHALEQAAQTVRLNQLGSDDWVMSLEAFDQIKWAAHEAVLQVAAEVKHMHVGHEDLANLLDRRAGQS